MKKVLFRLFAGLLIGSALAVGMTACGGESGNGSGGSGDIGGEQPHVHNYTATYTIEATCTERGYTMYYCPCGEHYEGDYVDELGHAYGEWMSNGDGTHSKTCKNDTSHKVTEKCNGGTATETERPVCDVCHGAYGAVIGHTHAFTEQKTTDKYLVSSATCTKKAVYYYSCECGAKGTTNFEYGELAEHKESDWVIDVAATTEKEGSKHTYCTVCETTLQRATIEKLKAESVGLAYEVNDDGMTCTVTGIGTCTDTDLVIPEKIYSYQVTKISSTAFYEYNSLKYSSLASIEIPSSVTNIAEGAFRSCSGLTKITVSSGNKVYYSEGNCLIRTGDKKLFLGCKNSVIPDGVTSIGWYAFYGCSNLANIIIPGSVTSIGNYAFYGCSNLANIIIPGSVTSIGYGVFSGCSSLTEMTLPFVGNTATGTSNTHFGYIFGAEGYRYNESYVPTSLKEVTITSATSIGEYAFGGCSSLTSIEIPDGVTSIGDFAFYGCSSLTSIEIPDSVTSIGEYAFGGCSSLTSIEIPDSVTSIGDYAFSRCSSLTSIEIPSSVTSIGDSAFSRCSSLTSIEIPSSVTSIGNYAFYECSSLVSINIPNSVTSIGNYAFYKCSSLVSINIPNSVTSIGNYAFSRCSSLTSIEIPSSVTSIGDSAFSRCSSLTSIEIPSSVTSIGNYAFYECSSLVSINIPNSVTSIGNYAFYKCSSLVSINIPNSVTSIGNYAFYECSSLVSINIPNSVTSIGGSAFSGCSRLTSVYYTGTVDDWRNISIGSYNGSLTSATRYYYSETKPTTTGNYWRYDTDGKTPVVWEDEE